MLPGRDKSSVWDQLEDAAMETFSLSRANLMPLPFFPVYTCVDVGVSIVLMNRLCVLMLDVIRGVFFSCLAVSCMSLCSGCV